MSLDKITKKIEEQARTKAQEIMERAEVQVKEIEAEAKQGLERLEAGVKREEAAAENEIRNAIILPAKLTMRGEELAAKNELVYRAFKSAMEFDRKDYKKVLSHLFSQILEVKGGVLYPAEGKEDITKEFLKESKAKVELGELVPDIMGGFLFKAGKIEYDCSFVTLLKKLREKLEPKIAPLFV